MSITTLAVFIWLCACFLLACLLACLLAWWEGGNNPPTLLCWHGWHAQSPVVVQTPHQSCRYAAPSLLAKHSFHARCAISVRLTQALVYLSSPIMHLSCDVKTHTLQDIHQLPATRSSLCIIQLVLDLAAEMSRCEAGAVGNPHPGL